MKSGNLWLRLMRLLLLPFFLLTASPAVLAAAGDTPLFLTVQKPTGLKAIFSPDDRHILTSYEATLWETEHGRVVRTFGDLGKEYVDIAFAKDGELVVALADDQVSIYDVATATLTQQMQIPEGNATAMSVTGEHLAVVTGSGGLYLWALPNHEPLLAKNFDESFQAVALGEGGRAVFVGGPSGTLYRVDVLSGADSIIPEAGSQRGIVSITRTLAAESDFLLVGRDQDLMQFYSLTTGSLREEEFGGHASAAQSRNNVAIATDDRLTILHQLYSRREDNLIAFAEKSFRDLTSGSHWDSRDVVSSISLSSNGDKLLVSATSARTFLLDANFNLTERLPSMNFESCDQLHFSPDGSLLSMSDQTSFSESKQVTSVDLRTGKVLVDAPVGNARSLFTLGGRLHVVDDADEFGTEIFDTVTGRIVHSNADWSFTGSAANDRWLVAPSAYKRWGPDNFVVLENEYVSRTRGLTAWNFETGSVRYIRAFEDQVVEENPNPSMRLPPPWFPEDSPRPIVFDHTGDVIWIGTHKGEVHALSLLEDKLLRKQKLSDAGIVDMVFLENQRTILALTSVGELIRWSPQTNEAELVARNLHGSTSLAAHAVGYAVCLGREVAFLNQSGDLLSRLQVHGYRATVRTMHGSRVVADSVWDLAQWSDGRSTYPIPETELISLDSEFNRLLQGGEAQSSLDVPVGTPPRANVRLAMGDIDSLKIEVVDTGGGIGKTTISINGTHVSSAITELRTVNLREHSLPGQANLVSVSTENAAGTLSSWPSFLGFLKPATTQQVELPAAFDVGSSTPVGTVGLVIESGQDSSSWRLDAIELSEDGNYFLAKGWKADSRIFHSASGKQILQIDSSVLSFMPDSKSVLVYDGEQLSVRDVRTGVEIEAYDVPGGRKVRRVDASPNGRYIAVSAGTGSAYPGGFRVLDRASGQVIARDAYSGSRLFFSPDSSWLVTDDSVIALPSLAEAQWYYSSRKLGVSVEEKDPGYSTGAYLEPGREILFCRFSEDSSYAIIQTTESLDLLSLADSQAEQVKLTRPLGAERGFRVSEVIFKPEDNRITLVTEGGLRQIDYTGRELGLVRPKQVLPGKPLVSRGENAAYFETWEGKRGEALARLSAYDLDTGEDVGGKLLTFFDEARPLETHSFLWHERSNKALVRLYDDTASSLAMLNTITGNVIWQKRRESEAISELALSDQFLAIGDDESKVSLWDLSIGRKVREFSPTFSPEESKYLRGLAISRDGGSLLASSSERSTAWATSGELLFESVDSHRHVHVSADGSKFFIDDTGFDVGGQMLFRFPETIGVSASGSPVHAYHLDKIPVDIKLGEDDINAQQNDVVSPDGKFIFRSATACLETTAADWRECLPEGYTWEALRFALDSKYLMMFGKGGVVSGGALLIFDLESRSYGIPGGLFFITGEDLPLMVRGNQVFRTSSAGGDGVEIDVTELTRKFEQRELRPDRAREASRDGRYVVTEAGCVWHTEARKKLWCGDFEGHGRFAAHSELVVFKGGVIARSTTGEVLAKVPEQARLVEDAVFTEDGQYFFVPGNEHVTYLYSSKRGERLATLVAFADGGWAVVDEYGRFDASDAGDIDGLHWVVGGEPVALEQLKDRYYEPGLLAKLLGRDDSPLRDVESFTTAALYPDVTDMEVDGEELSLSLVNRGGGIGRVAIWLNGKEVTPDASPRSDPNAPERKLSIDLSKQPGLINGDANTVEVRVFNGENYLSSRGLSVEFEASGDKVKRTPRMFGLIVGASDYAGESLDLRYASKDAAAVAAALELAAQRLFLPENVNLTLLADTVDRGATKQNIVNRLNEIAAEATTDDVLVVYMAGHGVTHGSDDNDYYYLTSAASSGNLQDPAIRAQVALSSSELTELMTAVPALKQVLILDTCGSGRVVERLTAARAVPASQIRALDRLKDRSGTFVLAGATADAVSYEATRYGQGLLTYTLLDGLRGAALRDEEFADVSSLFNYAVDRVPVLAADIGGIQRPTLATPRGGSSFDLGRLTSEDKRKIEISSPKPLVLRSNFQDEDLFYDRLSLTKAVNTALRNRSSDDLGAGFIFVDSTQYPDAYTLVGRYRDVEGELVLQTRAVRNGAVEASFEIKGNATDVDALAEGIVTRLQSSIE